MSVSIPYGSVKFRKGVIVRTDGTSRLLIDEPPLLVLPSLALAIGLNEAIFLNQLHYWLRSSGKLRDGRTWIYNTYDEWQKQFPFWSVRTIRRIVDQLEKSEIVLSSTAYNSMKIDKTKWYAIDYDALNRLTETADHVANLASRERQTGQSDEDSLATSVPESNQETSTKSDRPLSLSELEERQRRQEKTDQWIKSMKMGQKDP